MNPDEGSDASLIQSATEERERKDRKKERDKMILLFNNQSMYNEEPLYSNWFPNHLTEFSVYN